MKRFVLVTGCSGFIGYHTVNKLLSNNHNVIGIDNINSEYDTDLKLQRLKLLKKHKKKHNFHFSKIDISNKSHFRKLFIKFNIQNAINLAAIAGVRESINNPRKYLDSNIIGFLNLLELSNEFKVNKILYASTSSIYGDNNTYPSSEKLTPSPIQFYATTKVTNELMAQTWKSLYKMNLIGLRFFTVYGPLGRPDMALFKFTKSIFQNKSIELFNSGNLSRDFTYIDDIIEGIYSAFKFDTKKYKEKKQNIIFNLSSGKEVKLINFLKCIEKYSGKKFKINNLKMQKGDVYRSLGDISLARKYLGYKPKINIDEGIKNFINWYVSFYVKR